MGTGDIMMGTVTSLALNLAQQKHLEQAFINSVTQADNFFRDLFLG